MLLDQQFPMERAFAGPAKVLERFGTLDPRLIAAADPEAFADLCATPPRSTAPAVDGRPHAGPGRVVRTPTTAMPRRSGRDAARGAELFARLKALPGFGEQKAKIFMALLGKQLGVRPRVAGGLRCLRRGGLLPLGRRCRRRRVAAEGARFKKAAKAAAKAGA